MSDFAHDLHAASRRTRRALLVPEALAPRAGLALQAVSTGGHTRGGVPPRRACTEPASSFGISQSLVGTVGPQGLLALLAKTNKGDAMISAERAAGAGGGAAASGHFHRGRRAAANPRKLENHRNARTTKINAIISTWGRGRRQILGKPLKNRRKKQGQSTETQPFPQGGGGGRRRTLGKPLTIQRKSKDHERKRNHFHRGAACGGERSENH